MNSDYDNLLALAKKRRSIRRYSSEPIPDGSVEKIIEVARWAMSGANAQPWEFVVVKDAQTRKRIFELYSIHRKQTDVFNRVLNPELRHPVTGTLDVGQPSFRDAPVIIAMCGDTRTLLATSLAAEIMGYERFTYHSNIANATMMVHLAAASLGLGSQWVSTTPIWEGELKALLGVPEWYTISQIVPIGYADYTPIPSYRREVDEILHEEKFDMSKFRTDEQVVDYVADLRKRSRGTYYIGKRKSEK